MVEPLTSEIETFEVVALSDRQLVDAGWWYRITFNGFELGEPQGPFPSRELAFCSATVENID